MGEGSDCLVIRKRFPVSRQELFDAWTQPETMGIWMCPENIVQSEVHLDLKIGGSVLVMMHDGKKSYEHRGEFTIIDPPERLAFTWVAQATDFQQTLVILEFLEVAESESELVLTHEKFPRPEVRDRYRGGWSKIASRLDEHLRTKH